MLRIRARSAVELRDGDVRERDGERGEEGKPALGDAGGGVAAPAAGVARDRCGAPREVARARGGS